MDVMMGDLVLTRLSSNGIVQVDRDGLEADSVTS
jgi:hypothetical protein